MKKFDTMRKLLAIMLTVVVLFGTAAAESWTIVVVGFDFANAEVILEDEDGYQWTCPFGKNNWTLGEEYQLVFTETGAEIWDVE